MEGEGRTRITADAEVRKRAVVTTPNPPIKTDRDCRAAVRTVGTEVGRRKEQLIGGVGQAGHAG